MPSHYKYKTTTSYQNYLRRTGKPRDILIVDGILFTMDEYDMGGQTITYGNLKHKQAMMITTADRYREGFGDATVMQYGLDFWRNDINYIE